MDTIFALASARGKAGVAVVRLSGPKSFSVVSALSGSLPEPRVATLRHLKKGDLVLDEALVLTFPGPGSFTGEDVTELHLHGSIATVNAVLRELSDVAGLRLAEPGEFTRRALENERLDLAQIEGLSDLVEAETEAQRRQALRVFSGALGAKAESWRRRLVRSAALLEATIDFADEEVPVDVGPEVSELVGEVLVEIDAEVIGVAAAERVRDGFEVAIIGPPNVGKSTLLNALAGREAAITSEIAGTTRDVIEVKMDLRGLAVTFLDTAGIRVSDDKVEMLGIERAKSRAQQSDIRVFLLGDSKDTPALQVEPDDLVLVSKSDLGGGDISGKSGEGLDQLIEQLTARLESRASMAGVAIRERHRVSMVSASDSLRVVLARLESPDFAELLAEELRTAIRALDSLVGRVDVEDILDEIFSSFCIGK